MHYRSSEIKIFLPQFCVQTLTVKISLMKFIHVNMRKTRSAEYFLLTDKKFYLKIGTSCSWVGKPLRIRLCRIQCRIALIILRNNTCPAAPPGYPFGGEHFTGRSPGARGPVGGPGAEPPGARETL